LLGPSGCGKSTALNCIAGLQPLSGGGIWLDEKRIDVLPPEKRGFGMVFQNYALFPHMSVLDNVGFGLKMRGIGRSEAVRRAGEALQLVQLVGHERKLPGQLSGGQQQRVAIARAIVIEPPLILMDEPLSNLDTKLRIEMRAEIRRIHSQLERATLYVTHDQDEALSMADRIVVMKEGVVQQVATPKEVYTRPQNLHVGVSVPVAFALRRYSRYQKFVTTLLVIPVTLGTVLIADAMLTYFGPNGWFPQPLQGLHLYTNEVRLTHNFWLTFRRSRTQFGVNFVASLVGEMRPRAAGLHEQLAPKIRLW
jgi:ABC-type sulfate/molybdate transport systems ATPase subunit